MFQKLAIIVATSLVAVASLSAGQVQIGGANGLTNGTLTVTTTATQNGGGKFGEGTYSYSGLQNLTYSSAAPPTSGSVTAGGVTFQMINDSGIYAGDNAWSASNDSAGLSGNPSTVSSTFTIPMGIFGVTNVDTMLNDDYGVSGATNTTVTFNFGSALTGPGFIGSETFNLVNGTVIRDSVDCTGGTGLSACNANNYATTLGTGAYGLSGTTVTPSAGVASVTAFNVYSGTYSADTFGPYTNTSGNVYLDAQNFYLGSYSGDELYNVVITDSQTGQYQSRDMLTAITVATPEPSTLMLLMSGIGAVGLFYRRRKSAASV